MCVLLRARANVRMRACVCARAHVRTCVRARERMCARVRMCVRMWACACVCMYVCVSVRVRVSACASLCVCACVHDPRVFISDVGLTECRTIGDHAEIIECKTIEIWLRQKLRRNFLQEVIEVTTHYPSNNSGKSADAEKSL